MRLIRPILYCGALCFALLPFGALLPACVSPAREDARPTPELPTTNTWDGPFSITFSQAPQSHVAAALRAERATSPDGLVWQVPAGLTANSERGTKLLKLAATVPGGFIIGD